MPIFHSVDEAQTWCSQHFTQAVQPVSTTHWSLPHMNYWLIGTWIVYGAVLFTAGRVGLPQLWTDIKNIYAKIRNIKITTTAPAVTPANPPATTPNPVA